MVHFPGTLKIIIQVIPAVTNESHFYGGEWRVRAINDTQSSNCHQMHCINGNECTTQNINYHGIISHSIATINILLKSVQLNEQLHVPNKGIRLLIRAFIIGLSLATFYNVM